MAAGDVVWFDQALVDAWNKVHNLSADTIKVGLITSAVTPSATTSNPCWGAGGSTNLSTNEVTPGGNYTAGGVTLTTVTSALSAGKHKLDADDVSIAQHASNPTNARWAILYNNTATNKNCLGYVDLGTDINLSLGAFSITWHANGISTTDQA
jgi:hypothetical protein